MNLPPHSPRIHVPPSLAVLTACCLTLTGCERKEKVLDVKAPGVDIEVEKTESPTGETGIEIETGKK